MDAGFDLFAQSIIRKMNWSQRLDPFSRILQDAARPAWEKLTRPVKEEWAARAKDLQRTEMQRHNRDTSSAPRGNCRGRRGRRVRTTRNIHFRPIDEDDQDLDDYDDEFEFAGAISNQNEITEAGDVNPPAMDYWLMEKHERDKKRVKEWLSGKTKQQIVELRWLMFSVQTFGRNESECLLAEIGMDEFTLQEGVVDRLSSIVSGWKVSSPILESRAIFHSNETHEISLEQIDTVVDKVQLLAEILGRTEPSIAKNQAVAVGLYRNPEYEDDITMRLDNLHMFNYEEQFVAQSHRRPVLVLRHEYYAVVESMTSYKTRMRLDYEGFPTGEDRFILAEAFVEAVAEELGGAPFEKFAQLLSELGKPLDADYATQWEKKDELFCKYHALRRNACCAAVTVSRAIFIMLFSLEKLIKDQSI